MFVQDNSSMDSLISIITSVAGCFVVPIKHRINLITDYQTVKKDLKKELEKLSSVITIVEIKVKQAKNNGEKIIEEVEEWLVKARSTKGKVSTWLGTRNDMEIRCGPCPDCQQRYRLSKQAMKKMKRIVSLVERSNNYPPVSYPSEGIQLVSDNEFTAFPSAVVSVNAAIKALESKNKRIIGLIGMGGIGKTTLVKYIGKVCSNMFDKVVFAVVSQTPDIIKIQGQLIDMLGMTITNQSELGRAGRLMERIGNGDRILVILDDVWDGIDLKKIGIPLGCKIVITTRRERACQYMRCDVTIPLNLLEEDEAWDLFKSNAGDVLDEPSPELKNIAKQVVDECKNLPLALVVVACALRGKGVEEWELAAESLQRSRLTDIETADDRNVYACLRMSYDFLKAEATKKLLLLCSLFPEDHEINIEELAKYAVGFGLFQDINSLEKIISRVKSTIRDLKESSLLLKSDSMSEHVKMHDMVRDAALWITSKDKEPFIVPTPQDKNWVKNDELGEAMAISLLAGPMNVQFPVNVQFPKLKILLFAQREPLQLSSTSFEAFATLRVLDLTAVKYRMEMELPSSIKCLQNLRTLLLRRWKLRGDISIIGSLRNLEILSFSGSLIHELPIQLGELSELKYLDLSGCEELANTSLEVLKRLINNVERVLMPKGPMLRFEEDDDD